MLENIPLIQLNDHLEVPAIGLGTYDLNGADGVKRIVKGIEMGYRLIDSAFNYENEGAVGEAIRRCAVPRKELIITSKLPGRHQAYAKAVTTVQESLYRAGLDYYDLYLIHWPLPRLGLYVEAWQALIDCQKQGLIRSIGVCNFMPEHLERLIKETGVTPSLNQIELHPYFNQAAQRASNAALGIVTESWSPFGRKLNDILSNDTLGEIAKAHNKTISQVVLRWNVQLGAIPIPKAGSPEHQAENLKIFDFELSAEEMARINQLSQPEGRIANQDPNTYEEF